MICICKSRNRLIHLFFLIGSKSAGITLMEFLNYLQISFVQFSNYQINIFFVTAISVNCDESLLCIRIINASKYVFYEVKFLLQTSLLIVRNRMMILNYLDITLTTVCNRSCPTFLLSLYSVWSIKALKVHTTFLSLHPRRKFCPVRKSIDIPTVVNKSLRGM